MEAGNFVLVLNLIIIAVYANEKGNETDSFADTTRHCDAIEDQEGLCIYLKQCAPLLELLEQAKIEENTNFRALRILQRSTWACSNLDKSKTELKICCPLKFVLRPVNKRFFEEINLPQEGIKGVVKKLHPSFDLLPAIEDCGNVSITDRVVGGSNVELGTYGFIARIGYKVLRNGKIIHGCGGSLINKQYVITAAHCVRGIGSSIKPEEIRLGEFNTNSNPDCSRELGCLPLIDVKIEKIIVHPTYSAHYKWDDIALIRLKTPINYTNVIRPICLPFLEEYDIPDLELYKENSPAIVAGFGKTRWNQAIGSSILQHAEVPIQSHSKCAKLYHDLNYLNICAQGQGVFSKGDSCDGDSGGPLIVNKFESKLESKKLFQFQIGIVSYGPRRCGQGVLPGVYTKISEYKEFILESLEPFGSLQK